MNDKEVNASASNTAQQHPTCPVAPLTLQETSELRQRILRTIEALSNHS